MPIRMMLAALALSVAMPFGLRAQNMGAILLEETPRVFIDCSGFFCDHAFFRTEIGFVDHVRDRQDAHVHVLITSQRTAAGGNEYTASFIGLRAFRGMEDVFRHSSSPTDSADNIRRALARMIKLGLVRYVMASSQRDRLDLQYMPADQQAMERPPTRDGWNYWVFRTGGNTYLNGESTFNSLDLSGNLNASRTTEEWKVTLSLSTRFSESRFHVSDDHTIVNTQRNHGFNALAVRSLGPRVSVGARATVTSSTFLNQGLAVRVAPAIEYNYFPYAQSTRRQLTFRYSTGINQYNYNEQTIFLKDNEMLTDQSLIISYEVRQPWGSVSTSLEGAHFLHDPSKQRLVFFTSANLRLVKGLSLNLFGSSSMIRDQLYLPAGAATPEQILLRQRQLRTSHRYFVSAGLSYTFGSIFQNVVNPRFGGSSGGMIIYQ
jgi:hypothetical protein